MTLLQIHETLPFFTIGGAVILGLVVGSFLNVVIYRLPLMMYREWHDSFEDFKNMPDDEKPDYPTEGTFNLAKPNSTCPKCKSAIKPWHNIPVISYLLLKGKCANCTTPISIRYPVIEAITGILAGLTIFHLGVGPQGLLGLVFVYCLISLTMIDADHRLLPDSIVLPLLWLGLLANAFNVYTDLNSAVFGAVVGYMCLWSIYWLFKLLTGKEGMGYGDFKLLGALGAWMGWQYLPQIIILSSFVGAFVGIAGMIFAGRDRDFKIPFGPYLAAAGFIAFLWGEQLNQLYLDTL